MHICAELRMRCERISHPLGQNVHEAGRWVASTALMLACPLISDHAVVAGVEMLQRN